MEDMKKAICIGSLFIIGVFGLARHVRAGEDDIFVDDGFAQAEASDIKIDSDDVNKIIPKTVDANLSLSSNGVGAIDSYVSDSLRMRLTPITGVEDVITTGSLFGLAVGSIGSGFDEPQHMLHLHNANTTETLGSDPTGTDLAAYMYFSNDATGVGADSGMRMGIDASGTSGFVSFQEPDSGAGISGDMLFGTNSQVRLTLDGSGDVGIGTRTPKYKFHVEGDAGFSGSVYIGSNEAGREKVAVFVYGEISINGSTGEVGQVIMKTEEGLAWVAPALICSCCEKQ